MFSWASLRTSPAKERGNGAWNSEAMRKLAQSSAVHSETTTPSSMVLASVLDNYHQGSSGWVYTYPAFYSHVTVKCRTAYVSRRKERFYVTKIFNTFSVDRNSLGHQVQVYLYLEDVLFLKPLVSLHALHVRQCLAMDSLDTEAKAWCASLRDALFILFLFSF